MVLVQTLGCLSSDTPTYRIQREHCFIDHPVGLQWRK